jgi:hypothetical protein
LILFFHRKINTLTVFAYKIGNCAKNQDLLANAAVTWRLLTTLSTVSVDSCGDAMAIGLLQALAKPSTRAETAAIERHGRAHG